ncbi:MAG: prolipoprotein diacylglyceryl transferase [Desulfobacteraceae bacterium]|nr:prolipoprotein diacylglyceryl transferase [Desulfobacteraceae bacterium]
MFPVLFEIGPVTVYTYGFFVAAGALAAIVFARSQARRWGIDPDRITDLCFFLVIAAIVGSRLFYVAINGDYFIANSLEVLKIWSGGLVFYGGFVAALMTAVIFIRTHSLPFGLTADIAAMAVPLGHAFGRLGCFFAGCCHGSQCDLPWAVTFHNAHSLAPLNTPIHPTQLYSAAANLAIFGLLLLFRSKRRFEGQLFLYYVLFYGIIRSFIEIFRGDDRGAFLAGVLSVSQVMGLSSAAAALVLMVWMLQKQGK